MNIVLKAWKSIINPTLLCGSTIGIMFDLIIMISCPKYGITVGRVVYLIIATIYVSLVWWATLSSGKKQKRR